VPAPVAGIQRLGVYGRGTAQKRTATHQIWTI
jgi:hypothetical protein